MIAPDSYFAASYAEARTKFVRAARDARARCDSYVLPAKRGPDGEELTVDIAALGADDASQVLIVVSGTHGVEGHAGSACQIACLNSGLAERMAQSLKLVLIHAINPYGFAHGLRVNEDNIDLNRNFIDFTKPLPHNPAYEEMARLYLPKNGATADYSAASDLLRRTDREHGGLAFLKRAFQPGQYQFAEGLYYGGKAPAWSNILFRQILRDVGGAVERAAVLDVHSGLGPKGVGELLFLGEDALARHAGWFAPPCSAAGGATSVSSAVAGPLLSAAEAALDGQQSLCCALEFGTVDIEQNMKAMILENWARHSRPANDPIRDGAAWQLKNVYYCDDRGWKENVVSRALDVMRSLASALAAER